MGKKRRKNQQKINRSRTMQTRRSINTPAMVARESARSIMDALVQSDMTRRSDGGYDFALNLPFDEIAPAWRAVMRIEAEFLLADADDLHVDRPLREADQRRADAFAAVVRRASVALHPDLELPTRLGSMN